MTMRFVRGRAGSLLIAGALLVSSASLAFADEAAPTDAASAEAMVQRYACEAERYRALGGVGYKTGMVQRAAQESARYAALAAELRNPPLPRSPQAQYWAGVVEQYRRMGGVAYKSGLFQRAQAELDRYEPQLRSPPGEAGRLVEPWRWGKPIERFLMMGR